MARRVVKGGASHPQQHPNSTQKHAYACQSAGELLAGRERRCTQRRKQERKNESGKFGKGLGTPIKTDEERR